MDTNYTDLITVKHVDLTFGPFSSLLTAPAAEVAHRYGFAFVEGAGGSPLVFSEKLPNVFDVALPVANALDPLVNWLKSLPAGQRPTSAAYPIANDPFTILQVQRAQGFLQQAGHQHHVLEDLPRRGTRLPPQREPRGREEARRW